MHYRDEEGHAYCADCAGELQGFKTLVRAEPSLSEEAYYRQRDIKCAECGAVLVRWQEGGE